MNVSILFFILFIPILVIMMTAGAKGERLRTRFSSMIGVGLMLLLGLVLFVGCADRTSHPPLVRSPDEGNVRGPVASTEELWNRLTKPRIELETEHVDKPSADSSDEAEAPESDVESKPAPRPNWVDKPPKRVGNVRRTVVASDPFSTVDECFNQLVHRFPREIQKQLIKLVPSDQFSLLDRVSLDTIGITLDYIMREICREQFTETVISSVGEMKRVYVLMEFTPAIESHLLDSWQNYQRQFRIVLVAKIAAFILAALAVIYGLLRFDTWTRGYYTQRLLWGVPAAIIAIALFLFIG